MKLSDLVGFGRRSLDAMIEHYHMGPSGAILSMKFAGEQGVRQAKIHETGEITHDAAKEELIETIREARSIGDLEGIVLMSIEPPIRVKMASVNYVADVVLKVWDANGLSYSEIHELYRQDKKVVKSPIPAYTGRLESWIDYGFTDGPYNVRGVADFWLPEVEFNIDQGFEV